MFASVVRILMVLLCLPLLVACEGAWNSPYPAAEEGASILYTAFSQRPKHLDPVQSYSEDEALFLSQIYEPPLQYHYLERPYRLIPALAEDLPSLELRDAAGQRLDLGADPALVAESVLEIRLRPGVLYQPHPAFARDASGALRYHNLSAADLRGVRSPGDFAEMGTRELHAEDLAYQIRRLAHPRLNSPILELMGQYIVGLSELAAELQAELQTDERARTENPATPSAGRWIDLRERPLAGVEVVDAHTLRIRLHGAYPQFPYWLAMTFFAPVPWEADRFFAQDGMAERNLTLDWWPVGTGPYMLVENNPNARMVLARNPNFRGEDYPCSGEPGDAEAGLLADCGARLPMIDQVVFTREREGIPYWNKFLQGYYDASGISSDNFDQAVQMTTQGEVLLSPQMSASGIRLLTAVAPTMMYMGVNMQDPVVGGEGERARLLRRALSIAIDQEEFISVFMNGRGVAAMQPIPPGIAGHREGPEGINPYVYEWDAEAERPRRRSVAEARALLAEAGWPNGRDAQTGEPLVLYFDTTTGGFGDKARADWLIKQLRKLDVQLVMRITDFNRFQEKIRQGNAQLFFFGWNADYPDAENFLFLLHGAQSRLGNQGGVNAANFVHAEYDTLFERMQAMRDGPERQALIDRMLAILHAEAPWIGGFYPQTYSLHHGWVHNRKPGAMVRNGIKYQRLDLEARTAARAEWNRPQLWPLGLLLVLLLLLAVPVWRHYRAHERQTVRQTVRDPAERKSATGAGPR